MSPATTARTIALDVLVRVDDGAYSNVLLPLVLRESSLASRDRAFATELVYGTLRRRRTLDAMVAPALDRSPDQLDAPARAALRLGAYQLLVGVAAHAAVGETVAVAPRRARPLVNAVLRRVAAAGPPWPKPAGDDPVALGIRLSFPDWIVERLITDLGRDDAVATLDAANEPPPVMLRPRRGSTSPDELARELAGVRGADVELGRLGAGAVVVRGAGDIGRLPAVVEGRATPQDEASQAVVAVLDPQPGDRVLDTCAAPGGKATAAGERVGADGLVVAGDVHPGRARLVRRSTTRLDLAHVLPAVVDGRALPVAPGAFDRVLVDAPCTGLGVLRRRPEARWRTRADAVRQVASLQRALVREAATALRSGGTLVYSVCTLTRDETIAVDAWIAGELPHLEAQPPPPPPWRPWGRGGLLLPHVAGTDGMFVLELVNKGRGSGNGTAGGR